MITLRAGGRGPADRSVAFVISSMQSGSIGVPSPTFVVSHDDQA